jgi:hypothetical protein
MGGWPPRALQVRAQRFAFRPSLASADLGIHAYGL